MRTFVALLFFTLCLQAAGDITVSGARFLRDGKPFSFTGVSFFNAIYNPEFNKNTDQRRKWMEKFRRYGINVFRVWGQWDSKRGFTGACPECTLYFPDGRLRQDRVDTLKEILKDADALDMVVQLALFSHETYLDTIKLGAEESARAVAELTRQLLPHRNLTFQIWNEHSDGNVLPLVKVIRAGDPKRLVTNSPGFAGVLGTIQENQALDYLTPHTTRQAVPRHWESSPQEIIYLLARFGKPVVDDEPARNGTRSFGGPPAPTDPMDHILQIWQVWQAGGYVTYHHDMFQTGYGSPAVPPSGIPDPEFNPYHRAVFEFLSKRERYMLPANR